MNKRLGIIHLQYPSRASYYNDWLDAFTAEGFQAFNIFKNNEVERLRDSIAEWDLLVLLHSVNADNLSYLNQIEGILQDRKCPLVSFVGNEFNSPGAGMDAKRKVLQSIGTQTVATQLPLEAGEWLYEGVCESVVAIPHALNCDAFTPGRPLAERKRTLGVRSFRYPPYLGDDDRNRLLDRLSELAETDSKIDISTSERLDRDGWCNFLQSSCATASTEAGSWFLERDDKTIRELEKRFKKKSEVNSNSLVYRLGQKLPFALKHHIRKILGGGGSPIGYEGSWANDLNFEEIRDEFFPPEKRCPKYSKAISSRHFDAIGTKTIQVMIEGRYHDILYPDKHYLPLKTDLSNLADVLQLLEEPEQFEGMVNETYDYALESHTHRHRVKEILAPFNLL